MGQAPSKTPKPVKNLQKEGLTGQRPCYKKSNVLAHVVELVDAPASGAGDRKVVEVRVLSWAPCFSLFR